MNAPMTIRGDGGDTGVARSGSGTLWGLDPEALHDACWASRGVAVVRRATASTWSMPSADLYLLLDRGELVSFEPSPLARRRIRAASVIDVRVTDPAAAPYAERVVTDGAGALIEISRRYAAPHRPRQRVLLTTRRDLAASWRDAPSRDEGRNTLRVGAGLHGLCEIECHGRTCETTDAAAAGRLTKTLLNDSHDIFRACAGVHSPRPGVVIHDSAMIEAGARLVGAVWVGAGVTLRRGDVVVGPMTLADEVDVVTPTTPVIRRARRARLLRIGRVMGLSRQVTRRLLDVVFSLVGLVLGLPIFAAGMLAIWLEDGRPFFFAHERQTIGGRSFVCYKFRTMCRDAEARKKQLAGNNICDGPQFHIEDDPRLLRVGRIMRRLHLDELPQLVNVLLGQMTLIGPRPSPDEENQYCPAWREARLSVKPGLTGLWQVNRTRAPDRDFQEWIRHDLDYVDRQSWRLDLVIIARTIGQVLGRLVPRRDKAVMGAGRYTEAGEPARSRYRNAA